jgi:hypothetical protein
MLTDIFAPSTADPDAGWANTARLRNWYREAIGAEVVLKSVLGMEAFSTLIGTNVRAVEVVDGAIYALHGGALWQIPANGSAVRLATVPDGDEATIAGNNGAVCVGVDGRYFVWTGTALVEPAAGAFTDVGSVSFLGQRTVLTERDGRRVQWSGLADPETLGGLDFATTESRDDKNLRAEAVGGSLWIFKERSIERWYDTGAGLAAIGGSTVDLGLRAFNLLTKCPGGVFFVGSDGKAYTAGEAGLTAVSITAVETSIANENPEGAIYYEDEGHQFLAITFPSRPAWVFDRLTSEWHERAQGLALGAWDAKEAIGAYGSFFVFTDAGDVARLSRVNVDFGEPLIRSAISRTYWMGGQRFRLPQVSLQGRVGYWTGGTEPAVEMRTSRDRGVTWAQPRQMGLGAPGEYDRLLRFNGLGGFTQATLEVRCSEPYDVTLGSQAFVVTA